MKNSALILVIAAFYSLLCLPITPLLAQTAKRAEHQPPVIQHSPEKKPVPLEDTLIIQAEVNKHEDLKEVTLFFRTTGEQGYSSMKMEWVGEENYIAIIPRRFIRRPGIEYYIQASDHSGLTATQGKPNAPFMIDLNANTIEKRDPATAALQFEKKSFRFSTQATAEDPAENRKKPWYRTWWVWTIAMGVAAGVAAAMLGGSDDTKEPTSGTATVSGPVP